MSNDDRLRGLLVCALQGDREALGKLLDAYRPLLRTIAADELSGVVRKRVTESDVVQQTCLSACRAFTDFRGSESEQFLVWLKQIHRRNLSDVMGYNPSFFKEAEDAATRPVESVNWFEAIDFCNRLSDLLNVSPYYAISNEVRAGDRLTNASIKIIGGAGY